MKVEVRSGQDTAASFKGVLLQARKRSSPDAEEHFGTSDTLASNLKLLNCGAGTNVS